MNLYERIVEESPMRSGAVAVSVKTRPCKKPVGCHDRMRGRFRPDSPTDKLGPEANRIADLGGSLKSALMCRDVDDVRKYIKYLSQAIANVAKTADLPKSRQAFDVEQRIKCPKTEASDFPNKYGSVPAGSNRTGIGTAPIEDPRQALENGRKSFPVRKTGRDGATTNLVRRRR